MKAFKIQSTKTSKTLFEGHYQSFKHCLEDAAINRITLAHADLRGLNLSNCNLDNAILPHANFSASNLSGANISESYIKGATFENTALYNTCFAHSNMTACDFKFASFGATDICGSIINGAEFSSLSCFSLDFQTARQMDNCIFVSHEGKISTMSNPPIIIKGLNHKPLIITDTDIFSGHNHIDLKKCERLAQKITMREIRKRLDAA